MSCSRQARVNLMRRPIRIGTSWSVHISSYNVVRLRRSNLAASSIVKRMGCSPLARSSSLSVDSSEVVSLMLYNWTRRGPTGEISQGERPCGPYSRSRFEHVQPSGPCIQAARIGVECCARNRARPCRRPGTSETRRAAQVPNGCSFAVPAGTFWARRRRAFCRPRMAPSPVAPQELMGTEPIEPICAIADGGPSSVTNVLCAASTHSGQPPLRRSSRLLPASTSRRQWSSQTVRRAAGSLRECRRSRCHGRWG